MECLKNKYECFYLCFYNQDSGHATHLIKRGHRRWTSVGTFGLKTHSGKIPDIIKDWSGYSNFTSWKLLDENENKIMNG